MQPTSSNPAHYEPRSSAALIGYQAACLEQNKKKRILFFSEVKFYNFYYLRVLYLKAVIVMLVLS